MLFSLSHAHTCHVDQFTFHISLPSLKFTIYIHLENSPKQICVLIGLKPCFYNSVETQN